MHISPPRAALVLLTALIVLASPGTQAQENSFNGKKKGDWIESLQKDPEPRRRRAAVIALGFIGAQQDDIDRVLADALSNDQAPEVRLQILQEVRKLKREQQGKWTQRLGAVLKYEKHAPARVQAATILGNMDELARPVASNIIAACKDADPAVRAAILEAIGKLGPDVARDAVPQVYALLKDPDFSVRLNAVTTLGRLALIATDGAAELIQLLGSEKDTALRKEVVRVMGSFGTATNGVVPALTKVVQGDPSEELRQQAVLSLGKLGPAARGAVEPLKGVLGSDADKTVRLYLIRNLTLILEGDAHTLANDYAGVAIREKDTDLKLATLQELGAMGAAARDVVPLLKPLLEEPSVAVRREAKATIERILAPEPKKEGKP